MENLNITLDFTGQTPAGVGLGYLTAGIHSGKIVEIKHYEESNRIYIYMITDGIRHRESFNLSEKAMPFLMAFLVSAGVPEEKLQGKVDFPFHKLSGQTAYFNYTPPTMNSEGQPQEGSYPVYRFYTEAHYTQMMNVLSDAAPVVTNGKANGVSNGASSKAAAKSDQDFGFLLD